MKVQEFYYPSKDGKSKIHAVKWLPDREPLAILQIAHGVTEYILRYESLAKYLTEKGFIVVGNDHLGHGNSIATGSEPMYFGKEGSWNYVVGDIDECKKAITKDFPNLPYFILGFSLGSFVVRTYLIDYPQKLSGVILIGTGQVPKIQINIAKLVAKREAKKVGEDHTSPTIKAMTFGTYNKIFAPNITDYDWLCASQTSLDKYISDPNRGQNLSAGLFREMLTGMNYTSNKKNIQKMNLDTPILLLSGDKDPVGDCGKGVTKVYNSYKAIGIKDVTMKLYPNLRHDILNEDIKEDIYKNIYEWLKSKIDINY